MGSRLATEFGGFLLLIDGGVLGSPVCDRGSEYSSSGYHCPWIIRISVLVFRWTMILDGDR